MKIIKIIIGSPLKGDGNGIRTKHTVVFVTPRFVTIGECYRWDLDALKDLITGLSSDPPAYNLKCVLVEQMVTSRKRRYLVGSDYPAHRLKYNFEGKRHTWHHIDVLNLKRSPAKDGDEFLLGELL